MVMLLAKRLTGCGRGGGGCHFTLSATEVAFTLALAGVLIANLLRGSIGVTAAS